MGPNPNIRLDQVVLLMPNRHACIKRLQDLVVHWSSSGLLPTVTCNLAQPCNCACDGFAAARLAGAFRACIAMNSCLGGHNPVIITEEVVCCV